MKSVETPETEKSLSSNDAFLSFIRKERLNKTGTIEAPEDCISISNNETIRFLLRMNNLKLWQLADAMRVSEATVTRLMRHEISDEKFDEIVTLIHSMSNNTQEDEIAESLS